MEWVVLPFCCMGSENALPFPCQFLARPFPCWFCSRLRCTIVDPPCRNSLYTTLCVSEAIKFAWESFPVFISIYMYGGSENSVVCVVQFSFNSRHVSGCGTSFCYSRKQYLLFRLFYCYSEGTDWRVSSVGEMIWIHSFWWSVSFTKSQCSFSSCTYPVLEVLSSGMVSIHIGRCHIHTHMFVSILLDAIDIHIPTPLSWRVVVDRGIEQGSLSVTTSVVRCYIYPLRLNVGCISCVWMLVHLHLLCIQIIIVVTPNGGGSPLFVLVTSDIVYSLCHR